MSYTHCSSSQGFLASSPDHGFFGRRRQTADPPPLIAISCWETYSSASKQLLIFCSSRIALIDAGLYCAGGQRAASGRIKSGLQLIVALTPSPLNIKRQEASVCQHRVLRSAAPSGQR